MGCARSIGCTPRCNTTVANSLGWTTLRPLWAEAINPILDGRRVLLLAPAYCGQLCSKP